MDIAPETLLSNAEQSVAADIQPLSVTAASPILFSQLTLPVGITTDSQGNVFVGYENFGSAMAIFNPDGVVIGQVQLSPLISPVDLLSNARLALEPSSGQILALFPAGVIQSVDPTTGAVTPFLDLKQLPIQTDRVYDIAQGAIVNATAQIQPALANYGDIAVFSSNGVTDLYVSGLSTGFPFVARLRFTQAGLVSAEVVVSSIATAAPNQGQPPGVAVNAQGTVLTTLPIPNANATGNFNVPVAFPVDLNLQQGTGSFAPQLINIDVASTGMTADAAGNFYIATGATGTSLGGTAGAGAVVVLSPNLQPLNVLPIAQSVTIASNDVAVNPTNDRLYVTFNDTLNLTGSPAGGVALFPITVSQDSLIGTADASRSIQTAFVEADDRSGQGTQNAQVDLSWLSQEQSLGQIGMTQTTESSLNAGQFATLNAALPRTSNDLGIQTTV